MSVIDTERYSAAEKNMQQALARLRIAANLAPELADLPLRTEADFRYGLRVCHGLIRDRRRAWTEDEIALHRRLEEAVRVQLRLHEGFLDAQRTGLYGLGRSADRFARALGEYLALDRPDDLDHVLRKFEQGVSDSRPAPD